MSFLYNVAKSGCFYLAQGNLLRLLWYYPSALIPIILAGATSAVMYYNLTVWDALGWIIAKLASAGSTICTWLIDQFGEPAGKFVVTISALYIMLMGIAL